MTVVEQLRALLATTTPGPWRWWTSNSFRRLSSDATGKDGDVLWGYACRDGVPDIEGRQEDMEMLVAAVNALPALLDVAKAAAAAREAHNRGWDGDLANAMTALGIALHKLEEP